MQNHSFRILHKNALFQLWRKASTQKLIKSIACVAMLLSTTAVSQPEAKRRTFQASIAQTIEELNVTIGQNASNLPDIVLLNEPIVASADEVASGYGPVTQSLRKTANSVGRVIGASIIDEPAGIGRLQRLATLLVAPDQSILEHHQATPPPAPTTAVTFARFTPRKLWTVSIVNGFAIGLASVGDAEMAIPHLSDRGASLVMMVGGPIDRAQVERLAGVARINHVALLIAGRHCRRSTDCIESAAVNADGNIQQSNAASYKFYRPPFWSSQSSNGLPDTVPQPARYNYSPAMAELGRALFFDKRVSESGTIACSSCHVPSLGFSDGKARGAGVDGRPTQRNVVSLLNVAFQPSLRWDNYTTSLENFVKYPLSGYSDMDTHNFNKLVERIYQFPEYSTEFRLQFRKKKITFEMIELVLATYMRTLVSGDSAFDRAVVNGRRDAMSQSAWRGYELFKGRAQCSTCHEYSQKSPFFSNFQAHNTGLGWDPATSQYRDVGAHAVASKNPPGSFRTPTLRDVARTGPYMHDGSISSLRAVIDYFDQGGGGGPGRDPQLKQLNLSEQDKTDLEAFLIALSGTAKFNSSGQLVN
jgi:cytochrome c peroxidase